MINLLRHIFSVPSTTYASDHTIAFDGKDSLIWSDFCARVASWEALLAGANGELIALYERDSLEFMAALFALWRLGKQALVPANNLPATCVELAKLTTVFAGDFPLPGSLVPEVSTLPAVSLTTIPLVNPDARALVLFTSGSTSQPEPIAKHFAQLEAELTALEAQWGEQIQGASTASTVSHHHIYGLLFRLLWPLCAGRPFARNERDYWEELAKDAGIRTPLVIVSSPAHLSRIPPLTWPSAALPCAIFSSGAPLEAAVAITAKTQLGKTITEVYGSTETGGIGWREQDNNSHWTCLPGVEIKLDNDNSLLRVRSAHLPDHQWFTTADHVTQDDDGSFNLCGRVDRIVKVGGKRISLTAIERLLEQHPDVAQARIVLLPERGERLGAVVVLSNDGNKRLVDQGKAAINERLKSALDNQIDRIAIPRYWRYLGELPVNRQGKTTLADLQSLFASDPLPRLPQRLNVIQELNKVVLELFIPANLYYFDGHFPGRPILPGVVQTHWAVHYGREYWGELGEFAGLEAVKFQQVITANQTLLLHLEYHADKCKLNFSYTAIGAQTASYASGRVQFRRGHADGIVI